MAEPLKPASSPGLLLWRATLTWQRSVTAALKPLGLTHVQFVLLASTWWLNCVARERPSQRRIAEHANTDPMMSSQVIRTLAAKGLVQRAIDPNDSRARIIDVTPEGSELADRAMHVVEATDREFFAAVSDQQTLMEQLRALAH